MAIDEGTFETLSPSRFLTFSFPNPDPLRLSDSLRLAVLDSPQSQPTDPHPRVAALLVPKDREHDWIFSTLYGQLQLLASSPSISRLILVGNPPRADSRNATYTRPIRDDDEYRVRFEKMLLPILLALSPKSAFKSGIPDIPFLVYEDNVLRGVSVDVCNGSVVGEMLVEDVEIEMTRDGKEAEMYREFRRRLRFRRMPNLVQTQMRIVSAGTAEAEVRPDMGFLVQPYLPPMVASLSLIALYLEECIGSGLRPRVLCVGVGGGALLSFLRARFGFFDILGVEMDETVLWVARRYFGLMEDEFLRVFVGDGIKLIENFARRAIRWNSVYGKLAHGQSTRAVDFNGHKMENVETGHNVGVGFGTIENSDITCNSVSHRLDVDCGDRQDDFDDGDSLIDVIMVDLDSSDAANALSAPPLEFVQKSVLLAVRSALHERGIFAMNVIPRSDSFYVGLVSAFREVFSELYEIDVGNGENIVLIATASSVEFVGKESKNNILEKLRELINCVYIDRLRKI